MRRHPAAPRRPIRRPGPAFYLLLIIVAAALGGCATPGIQPPEGKLPTAELSAVPFFPQSRYQCGPAALATVLTWSGRSITPEALKPRVYVPERRGTLQAEVKAAARGEHRLAYPLQGRFQGLLEELQSGHPVLVMQNLGLSWLPQWHYAVVVGTANEPRRVLLRSGRDRRRETPVDTFLRTWQRADFWGLVVLRPGTMPATAKPLPYLQAASALEGTAGAEVAVPAYRAGKTRWPADARFVLALANAQFDAGAPNEALKTLKTAVEDRHSESVMLLNNLALVAAELTQWAVAERAIERALSIGGPYRDEVLNTREEIRCMRAGETRPDCQAPATN